MPSVIFQQPEQIPSLPSARPVSVYMLSAIVSLSAVWHGAVMAQAPADPPPPVQAFIYLEPFEMRTEFLVRPGVLGAAVEPTPDGRISKAERSSVLENVTGALEGACTVKADGTPVAFTLVESSFVAVDPDLGPVPDDRDEIPGDDAIVAAVFASSTGGFPRGLEVAWSLFGENQPAVPVVVEALERAQLVGADFSQTLLFTEQNRLQEVELPPIRGETGLLEVEPVSAAAPGYLPWLVVTLFVIAGATLAVLAVRKRFAEPGTLFLGATLSLLFAGGAAYQTVQAAGTQLPGDDEAPAMVEALLKNVYHAFAFRDESAIYDTLARSVDGPLLESLYIDIRNAIEGDGDAPAVRVLDVTIIDCVTQPSGGRGGMLAHVAWASRGTVSHLGHSHTRHNNYRAEFLIEPVDGTWKITGVEFKDIERA